MEVCKVITRSDGGTAYIRNAMNYCLDDRRVLTKGYGVNQNSPEVAAMQFEKNAEFWNNGDKNPFLQFMISFTEDTAPTADEAMRLNEEIIRPFTEEHLVMSVVHNEKRDSSLFHVHNYVSTTNYNDGSMLYSDNRTNYGIAQRVADVTGKETALSVTYEQGKEWECPEIFTSQDEE